jgi:hypothetical protein
MQTLNRMIRDAREHVSEPGTGIAVVEFDRDDQRIRRRRTLTAAIGLREQPPLPLMDRCA